MADKKFTEQEMLSPGNSKYVPDVSLGNVHLPAE